MIPAKNRDRKCSTCRHYQPSPLWRKGWCRNPLLYDRNTNHLVEADSLACNRTFIDYWEPANGTTPAVSPQARSSRPRIAPSIPIDTTDAQGHRGVVTGNTPAAGMSAVGSQALYNDPALREPEPRPGNSREVPKLSIVTPDFAPDGSRVEPASRVTRQIEEVKSTPSVAVTSEEVARTAAQRIRDARRQERMSLFTSTRGRILLSLLALLVVAGIVGGYLSLKNKGPNKVPAVVPTVVATRPLPTPTGFGDATATPPPVPTVAAPPAGQIGINGWVVVSAGGGLTLRQGPSKTTAKIGTLADGTKAHVIGGPTAADGFNWWQVDKFDGKNPDKSGWLAGQFLKASTAP